MTRLERDVWVAVYAAAYVGHRSMIGSGHVTEDERTRWAAAQADAAAASIRGSIPLRTVEELEGV